jgi:signal transduction histidine kinase
LVLRAADFGLRTSRAKEGFAVVLQGHHDAVGLLTAALFSAHKLAPTSETEARTVDSLRRDLEALHAAIGGLKEEALSGVTALDAPIDVDLSSALASLAPTLERVMAPAAVAWQLPSDELSARVTGGEATLRRVLLNLLLNARDGDGLHGASKVVVRLWSEGGYGALSVEDDGPGVHPGALKARGTGTGLRYVRAVAEGSGGSFQLESAATGACACVRFPLAGGTANA